MEPKSSWTTLLLGLNSFVKVAQSQKVFSIWLDLPKNNPNHYPEHILFLKVDSTQDLAHYFGDEAKVKKLSEIRPPLQRKLFSPSNKVVLAFAKKSWVHKSQWRVSISCPCSVFDGLHFNPGLFNPKLQP